MLILCKKRFEFRDGGERFTTQGGDIIEKAPDWIAKHPLYDLAVKDGDIYELVDTVIVPGSSPAVPETNKKGGKAEK